jgi:hypothetical protein
MKASKIQGAKNVVSAAASLPDMPVKKLLLGLDATI